MTARLILSILDENIAVTHELDPAVSDVEKPLSSEQPNPIFGHGRSVDLPWSLTAGTVRLNHYSRPRDIRIR
jgi:hypothetical protein